MDEAEARDVTAVRAIETADGDRSLWTDADRDWASRAAAQTVGASAAPEAFVSRRAALVLERLDARHPAYARTVRAFGWPRAVAPVVVLAALALGVVIDRVGSGGRIDILAPPVLGLLAWNVAVYAILIERWSMRWRRRARGGDGPLRQWLAHLAGKAEPRLRGRLRNSPVAGAIAAFTAAWTPRVAPLHALRAARVLHLAAAALAAGVLAGLYLRGLAFEYRATWASTFLDAPAVHALLALALAPGSALTGIPVPDVVHIASIRSGANPGSENAAPWLHLYAATVLLVVIVPRLALALVEGLVVRQRARAFSLPLAEPYFRRLLRGFDEGPFRIRVLPYSYTLAPDASGRLQSLLSRALGTLSEVAIAAPVPYGAGSTGASDDASLAIALFNAASTPEASTHAAFAAALAADQARPCIVVVDESTLRARWGGDEARLEERRAAWREALHGHDLPLVFVDLGASDLASAEAALQQAIA
jgi:hypothetical protein